MTNYLETLPINFWQERIFLKKIASDIERMETFDSKRLHDVRDKLNEYSNDLRRSGENKKVQMVHATIYIVKKIMEAKGNDVFFDKTQTHFVSDHAFCTFLLRTGTDLDSLKTKAYEMASRFGLEPKIRNGKVITYLCKYNDNQEQGDQS